MLLLLAAGLFPARRAGAQADAQESPGPRQGLSLGGRAAYYRPNGAEHGDVAEGAQLRLHFARAWALEGSADLRHDVFGGTKVDVIPVQLSLMAYILPSGYSIFPYLLAGGGWYYTHVGAPLNHSLIRFGPHAGAGVEFFLSNAWSLDTSFRYLWTADINSQDPAHPAGQNFSDKGFMLTGALNYNF
ncbi:MAG: outer membrane beta-barrel protein [Elusimicrobia bacterium]|nr:outer membrane beta-barrel protein [Elusimicrobiota bacterium]